MLEAKIKQGKLLKMIVEAIKDLVNDGNLECTRDGITLQAMDSSHVSLVSLTLKESGFENYRCDRNVSLGVNLVSLGKILKCAGNDDIVTLKAEDDGDIVTFLFESADGDRVSDFALKLMDIDSEHLGIPETDHKCIVKLPSGEFTRIVRDLGSLGETCTISCANKGIKFSVKGDLGTGNITRKHNTDSEKPAEHVSVEMEEATEMTFALRYLLSFTKAAPLSETVELHMTKDIPLTVVYNIEDLGSMKFYLAPKIDEA